MPCELGGMRRELGGMLHSLPFASHSLWGMPHSLPFAFHYPGGMLHKLQGKRLEILFGFLAACPKPRFRGS